MDNIKVRLLERKLKQKDERIKELEDTNLILEERLDEFILNSQGFEERRAELDSKIQELEAVYKDISALKKEYQEKLFEFEKMKLEYRKAAKNAVKKIKKDNK